jgi:hypothetical protein
VGDAALVATLAFPDLYIGWRNLYDMQEVTA